MSEFNNKSMEIDEENENEENDLFIQADELDEMEEVDVMEGEGNDIDEDEGEDEGESEEVGEVEIGPEMANFIFTKHTDSVYSIAIHPTVPGLILTGGIDDKAYLWRLPSDLLPATATSPITLPPQDPIELTGHTDTVTSVGFNFNGTLALTGSYDGTVRIWKLETLECIQVLEGPEDIEWAVWHNKGNAVLAGSSDGTVWMWITHNGQCVQVFAGHDGLVSNGGFADDGKIVCTTGEDGTVRVWMPKTGVCKFVFNERLGHESLVTCLSIQGDNILTGSADGTSKLYNITSLKLVQTFVHSHEDDAVVTKTEDDMEDVEIHSVECVGFANPALKWIATGGMDKKLKIWDRTNGNLRSTCEHNGGVVALAWHPTLPFIATGSLDYTARIWDVRNGNVLMKFTGHTNLITNISLFVSPNESQSPDYIVTASDDNTSRVFLVDFKKF